MLRDFGLPPGNPQARRACALLLDRGLQRDGGINYFTWGGGGGPSETCITGMVLSILSYFEIEDSRLEVVAGHLIGAQMPDGGWNCRRPRGATHSSVHTTINALEGLRNYETSRGRRKREIRAAQARGREFLLRHRLFRSHRTGKVISPVFTRMVFPPRWHYDILRALDHFQTVRTFGDERLAEAIAILRARRREDGCWLLPRGYPGKTWFELERAGGPSRWNTLRALRVLKWWKDGMAQEAAPSAGTTREEAAGE
jgi:hypothetical protein